MQNFWSYKDDQDRYVYVIVTRFCLEAEVVKEMERGRDAGAATTMTASERGTGDAIETGASGGTGVTEIEERGREVIGGTGRGVIGETGVTETGDTGIGKGTEIDTRILEGGIDRAQDRLILIALDKC